MRELVHVVQFDEISDEVEEFGGAHRDWLVYLALYHQGRHGIFYFNKRLAYLFSHNSALNELVCENSCINHYLGVLIFANLLNDNVFDISQLFNSRQCLLPVYFLILV